MKTPELGDVLLKRKGDRIPLGFIISTKKCVEIFNFQTQKKDILPNDFKGILMNKDEIEKIFPLDENLRTILNLINKFLSLENEKTLLKEENIRLRKDVDNILDQANEYWSNHHQG